MVVFPRIRRRKLTRLERHALVDPRNDRFFPGFRRCPPDWTPHPRFYRTSDGERYYPKRHWCLVAEIRERGVGTDFICLLVKDKTGHEFNVVLFETSTFDPRPDSYPVGHTVAILYATQHEFDDACVGVRVVDPRQIQVLPFSFAKGLGLIEMYRARKSDDHDRSSCDFCGDLPTHLSMCSPCRLYRYCNKDCQMKDWRVGGHRHACRGLEALRWFFDKEWSSFEGQFIFRETIE